VDTRIVAIGIATFYCYESPKPLESGQVGMNWERVGWRVRVRFTRLSHQILLGETGGAMTGFNIV
jgi:hypothetical protein